MISFEFLNPASKTETNRDITSLETDNPDIIIIQAMLKKWKWIRFKLSNAELEQAGISTGLRIKLQF